MTRGSFYLITNKKLYGSTEFNGGMYPEHHGNRMFEALKKISSKEEFNKLINKFNGECFEYPEEMIYDYELSLLINNLDFNKDYFDFRFSDWLFIKNISDETYTFILKDKKKRKIKLVPNQTMRFRFGEIDDEDEKK